MKRESSSPSWISQLLSFKGNKLTKGQVSYNFGSKKDNKKGMPCIFAIIKDMVNLTPKLEDVPVVSKYLYIFLDESPVLPLDREIEFEIDLVFDTQLIFILIYRMTLTKLKELKVQSQDLWIRITFDRVPYLEEFLYCLSKRRTD